MAGKRRTRFDADAERPPAPATLPSTRSRSRAAGVSYNLVGMEHDANGYTGRPILFHRLDLDRGRIMFTGEDIGEPAEARDFLMSLGAEPDDQCVVDTPGRRWQCRIDDLGLIDYSLDAPARTA